MVRTVRQSSQRALHSLAGATGDLVQPSERTPYGSPPSATGESALIGKRRANSVLRPHTAADRWHRNLERCDMGNAEDVSILRF